MGKRAEVFVEKSPLLQLPNTFRAFYGAFPGLHKAQRDAIAPILQGEDLVLQAATGSGKSEAVLAPSLERVITSDRTTAVLYIIPTRALAVDLKRRFEYVITERLGLNLAIRTGDIKRTGGKRPDIMFTTPESLDVMLGSSNADLKAFLFRVGTVIIDEVHPLVHQYRGRHLTYLFTRLERRQGRLLQKIAMSATIANIASVISFFNFSTTARKIITSVKRDIAARLIHLKQEEYEMPALLNDLYETWHYRKILLFANSRSACDRLFSIVNATGKFQGVAELHYSNLKPLERKGAEERFRKNDHAMCIATSTLELGIDVGDVDAVLLYEPPNSVSAFLQRIGRANRRQTQINFWGICQGERACDQVVRFLALLELSRKGIVESPCSKKLPSVLSQQVISCLYEKKQISLASMQSLFLESNESKNESKNKLSHGSGNELGNELGNESDDESNTQDPMLPSIFASLKKKGWLRNLKVNGLLAGGWQYRKHLFEYKIWGNFPEAEEVYVLEVANRAVADIGESIVGQIEVGDCVFLAGRRLRIIKINKGERKQVLARPTKNRNEKQIYWIGKGPHISYEVAQAMGAVLKTEKIEDEASLFTRTKKLLNRELAINKKIVILENGIEVVPGKKACYRYRTFLGSAGNLVLEWSIRDYLKDDDLFITSDEIGIECSNWIIFEDIPLPENRENFKIWVKQNFKILCSLIPLNLFSKTLPGDLIILELTDFLFDIRVVQMFSHYSESRSKIIVGDKTTLDSQAPIKEDQGPWIIDIIPGDSLLHRESLRISRRVSNSKSKMESKEQLLKEKLLKNSSAEFNFRANLTATMVSDYFLYKQCKKRFCLKFLRLEPPFHKDNELAKHLIKQGKLHETEVLTHLKEHSANLIFLPTTGSPEIRFNAFIEQFQSLIKTITSSNAKSEQSVFLSQCLLMAKSIDNENFNIHSPIYKHSSPGRGAKSSVHGNFDLNAGNFDLNGMGVPDLLLLSVKKINGIKTAVIEAGDIKSSRSPRFHQKWQVAFYALLLKTIINSHGITARVAETGFLLTKKKPWACISTPYEKHIFDLKPYMAAFPMLLETMHSLLCQPASAADHRLQSHCLSCEWFDCCYRNALENEEIQFLPGLTPGELLKLRAMGCTTIAETHATLEQMSILHSTDSAVAASLAKDYPAKNYPAVDSSGTYSSGTYSPGTYCPGTYSPGVDSSGVDSSGVNSSGAGSLVAGTPALDTTDADFLDANASDADLQNIELNFTHEQRKHLLGRCTAFLENKIILHKKNTRLFPHNISNSFFVDIVNDPVAKATCALAWQVVNDSGKMNAPHVWIMENNQERTAAWQEFADLISASWNKSISSGTGPHIFHFGARTRLALLEWGVQNAEVDKNSMEPDSKYINPKLKPVEPKFTNIQPAFLWQTQPSHWTDLQKVFQAHFYMPTPGIVSLFTLAHVFNCKKGNHGIDQPETLFHSQGTDDLELYNLKSMIQSRLSIIIDLYSKAKFYLKSQWQQEWEKSSPGKRDLKSSYLRFIEEEERLKENDILTSQEQTLQERMQRFRAIGYLKFSHTRLDDEGRFIYIFTTSPKNMDSKFRKGDFLKLAPHGIGDIQNGFSVIIAEYDINKGEIALLTRSGRLNLSRQLFYSLEEDTNDLNQAKLIHVVSTVFSENQPHFLQNLLFGDSKTKSPLQNKQPCDSLSWLKNWINSNDIGLNPSQLHALSLPFQYKTTMIQGPPGTGKTHLLGWILTALIIQAHEAGTPLRIGVSALTHQAIENVMKKVTEIVNLHLRGKFPGHCIKWGKALKKDDNKTSQETNNNYTFTEDTEAKSTRGIEVELSNSADDILSHPWLILGATGYGFYNLFNSKKGNFPKALDWVVFDEASQVLVPQALLSLIYGKNNFLFLGDVNQLPPIVLGNYENEKPDKSENVAKSINIAKSINVEKSILAHLRDISPENQQAELDITYRMNREICDFPSRMWYGGRLHPEKCNADARLHFTYGHGTDLDFAQNLPTKLTILTKYGLKTRKPKRSINSQLLHIKHLHGLFKKKENEYPVNKILDEILDPSKPVVLVISDHKGCSQKSEPEAELMAELAHRFILNGVKPEQIALISPHRAQNNNVLHKLETIVLNQMTKGQQALQAVQGEDGDDGDDGDDGERQELKLPLVDTVERIQGAQRDVIIFGITSSDPDYLLSNFLNNPNRLNVSMTRAKKKLIIIGSRAFFTAIPDSEAMLCKNRCFKKLLSHCQQQNAVFHITAMRPIWTCPDWPHNKCRNKTQKFTFYFI